MYFRKKSNISLYEENSDRESKKINFSLLSAKNLEEERLVNLKKFNKNNVIYYFNKNLKEIRKSLEPEKENKLRIRDFSEQVKYNLSNLVKNEIDTLFYYFDKYDDNFLLYMKYNDEKKELLRLINKYELSFSYFEKEYNVLKRIREMLEEDLNISSSKIDF